MEFRVRIDLRISSRSDLFILSWRHRNCFSKIHKVTHSNLLFIHQVRHRVFPTCIDAVYDGPLWLHAWLVLKLAT